MLDLGEHAGFILASYAISLAAVAGLIGFAWYEEASQARRLARLTARGLKRRSAGEK